VTLDGICALTMSKVVEDVSNVCLFLASVIRILMQYDNRVDFGECVDLWACP